MMPGLGCLYGVGRRVGDMGMSAGGVCRRRCVTRRCGLGVRDVMIVRERARRLVDAARRRFLMVMISSRRRRCVYAALLILGGDGEV